MAFEPKYIKIDSKRVPNCIFYNVKINWYNGILWLSDSYAQLLSYYQVKYYNISLLAWEFEFKLKNESDRGV